MLSVWSMTCRACARSWGSNSIGTRACPHSLARREPYHAAEIPLGKTVFRAMLARIAALCNERTPNSVSPYGGEGEFSIWTEPPTVFHVAFTNTPDEQRIELIHVRDGERPGKCGRCRRRHPAEELEQSPQVHFVIRQDVSANCASYRRNPHSGPLPKGEEEHELPRPIRQRLSDGTAL